MEVNEDGDGKILQLTTQRNRNSLWYAWRTVAGLIILVLVHTHTQKHTHTDSGKIKSLAGGLDLAGLRESCHAFLYKHYTHAPHIYTQMNTHTHIDVEANDRASTESCVC